MLCWNQGCWQRQLLVCLQQPSCGRSAVAAAMALSFAAYLNLEPELPKRTVLHLALGLVGLVRDALQSVTGTHGPPAQCCTGDLTLSRMLAQRCKQRLQSVYH